MKKENNNDNASKQDSESVNNDSASKKSNNNNGGNVNVDTSTGATDKVKSKPGHGGLNNEGTNTSYEEQK